MGETGPNERPIPKPDNRGRNKARDWRVALERLGMMRLLHQLSLRELPEKRPKAWGLYGKRRVIQGTETGMRELSGGFCLLRQGRTPAPSAD